MSDIEKGIAIEKNDVSQKPFYKVLEQLERRMGLSEREVIRRLGIPRSTYRSWKDGTCEPSKREYWRRLKAAFGVSFNFSNF